MKTSPLMTGLTAGVMIGTAAYMLAKNNHQAHNASRMFRRNAGRALKTVGNVIENMSYMMR